MNPERNLRFGRIGALGAIIAWALTEPFATTVTGHGAVVGGMQFTLGSVFGWLGMGAFGGFVCGLLSYALALERAKPSTSWLRGGLGFLVGFALAAGADAASDLIGIRLAKANLNTTAVGVGVDFLWQILMCVMIGLAIALVSLPSWKRARRMAIGGLVTGLVAFVAKLMLSPMCLAFDLIRIGADLEHPPENVFIAYASTRLVEHVVIGFFMGALLAGAESALAIATVRWRRASDDVQEFPIFGSVNRIGARDGLEVALIGASAVADVHAAIVYDAGRFTLVDGGSPAGTWRDGRRITRERIADGDSFTVGTETLTFHTSVRTTGEEVARPTVRHSLVDAFGASIPLGQGENVVGRGSGASVRIDYDASVRDRHATIEIDGETAILRAPKTDDVTVGGETVTGERRLEDGDQLGFANVGMTYRRTNVEG